MNDHNSEGEKTVVAQEPSDDRTQVVSQSSIESTQYAAGVECPVCGTTNPPSELFCTDCGFELAGQPVALDEASPAAPTVKLVSADGTREFTLKPGENTVGRENADVLLVNNTVSRGHARITVEDGGVFLEDLNSTNGTLVDGGRAEAGAQTPLHDGAEIVFGSVSMRLEAPSDAAAGQDDASAAEAPVTLDVADEDATTEPDADEPAYDTPADMEESEEAPAQSEAPVAGLLVSGDGLQVFEVYEGANTIGRRQGENSIAISDPYCSGRHADLTAEGGRFTLTDIGSTNGTLVNGVKLEPDTPREVFEGDEITFGRSALRLVGG